MANIEHKITFLTGTIEFKEPIYKLYKIKPTGLFKWFKKPMGVLKSEFLSLTGEYESLKRDATQYGLAYTEVE